MSAYLIIDAVIHDRVAFGAYAAVTAKLVTQFGGRYLVLGGGEMLLLEGAASFAGKAVVSEWPSREAAIAFWNSPEYAEARKLRESVCDARVTLVDGFPMPATALS